MGTKQMNRKEPYPYPLHTNRELEMMLAGSKPFAVFAHERVDGFEKSDVLANQDFATHIANGKLSEHVRTGERKGPGGTPIKIDYYFYALEGEEWRVASYWLLLELLHRGAWCPQLEWLEGKLLGYTDEKNRYHLSQMYPVAEIDRLGF
jgi:hypothetical protein